MSRPVYFVKICVSPEGNRYVRCFCEDVDIGETRTVISGAQIPVPHWSDDGKTFTMKSRKLALEPFDTESISVFAYPHSRPPWFQSS